MINYNLNSVVERIKFAREAAEVKRHHTNPTLMTQTDGHHTFNMLTMLRILYPEARIELVWAILEHDIPERIIGDSPAPSKWFGFTNESNVDHWEVRMNEKVFGSSMFDRLTNEEKMWLSGLDLLEYYCFCKDELKLGNSNMKKSIDRVERVFSQRCGRYPIEIVGIFYEIRYSEWERLPDLGDET